ncbi:MAG TPA: hypothetical protein VF188_15115 [Longimicrobiales bacterium]
MPDDRGRDAAEQPLAGPVEDPEFQKKWIEARDLSWDQVERAFRHGFDARDRFAERPFREVEEYLRESWNGMGPPAAWDDVADIVRSGYERYKGAGLGPSTEDVAEALRHFPTWTVGGSAIGGIMGEQPLLGAAEPVSDYDGEGGRPVGGEEAADGGASG